MNYYSVLGVTPSSTTEEIKQAYKRLAMEHHPDRSTGSSEKFSQIKEAYDVLVDPVKRNRYNIYANVTVVAPEEVSVTKDASSVKFNISQSMGSVQIKQV